MTEAPDPLRDAALRYAGAGQPVFPCGVLRKTPNGKLVPHGFKDATTRAKEISNWWSRVPRSNVGWPTQVRGSDPFVVDVDTKRGIDGWAAVTRLNAEHPHDPIPLNGPRTVTPSPPPNGLDRGAHIWLRAEDGLPVPDKASFVPGLDTRGQGGYVLVTPSRTEDGEYQGEPPLDPSAVPFAPKWLLEMVRGRTTPDHEDRDALREQPTARTDAKGIAGQAVRIAADYWKPGTRRLLTHSLAVFFGRDLGLDKNYVTRLIRKVAELAGDPEPIALDKIADAWKKIGTGERASVKFWLDQAGVPELGARLFGLSRGPSGTTIVGSPWAGKPGWEEEPQLEIKTEKKTIGHGDGEREIDALVEPAYAVYNALVLRHAFRPFRTLSGEPRVAVPTAHGVEVYDPRSAEFVDWVGFRYYALVGDKIPTRDLGVVAKVLSGRASAPELPRVRVVDLSIRVAPVGRYETLLDLGDPERRCVRIGADGWTIERIGMPVFERPSHMLPLPEPERVPGGDWTRADGLFAFVSLGLPDPPVSEDGKERDERARRLEGQRLLIRAEVVHSILSPRSPKVIPLLNGDDGSGKSHAAAKLGAVADPSIVQHVPIPETEQDLLALALNRATISLDNVSHIDLWLSDALARLCTGTGLAKRKLYTDRDEVVSRLIPRIILNGITAVPRNPDLIRRVLFLWAVRPERTLGDEEYDDTWTRAHPAILGGFLDLACLTANVLRDSPPDGGDDSMADFVRIGRAVAIATGRTVKDFDYAWAENQSRQLAIAEENPWVGALAEVFRPLKPGETITPESIARRISEAHRESFPKGVTSQEVGNAIARTRRTLRTLGLPVESRRGHAGIKLYFVAIPVGGLTGLTQRTLTSEKQGETQGETHGETPDLGLSLRERPPGEVPPEVHPSPELDFPSENPTEGETGETGETPFESLPGSFSPESNRTVPDPEDLFTGGETRADRARNQRQKTSP